jgi:hypothetical protein
MSLTTRLAGTESNEQTDNSRNDEGQTNEIKLCNMFTESSSLVRIEVKGEEQNRSGNAASRQVYPETPRRIGR